MSEIIPTLTLHPGELTAHPANSNTHNRANIEELAESRRLFDQYKNVVTWSPPEEIAVEVDGQPVTLKPGIKYVIAGNGFHQASLLRQDDAIEVKDYSHLSYDEALLLMETDNASPLGSRPDPERMKENMERAQGLIADNPRMVAMMDRARELAGISENGKSGGEDAGPQVDKAAKLKEKWGVELGQLWALGEHRLAVGDCADKAVVGAVMAAGERTQVLVTDPPYGQRWLSNQYGPNRSSPNPMGRLVGDEKPRPEILTLCFDYLSSFSAVYVCTRWKQCETWTKWINSRIPVRNQIVWHKNNWSAGNLDGAYAFMYEQIIFASNDDHKLSGKRLPDVWAIDRVPPELHPTEKPVELMQRCVEKSSGENDIVADPFLGSGTTLIACEQLGRRCRAVEIDPGYAAVSIQRWVDLTDREPKLLSG